MCKTTKRIEELKNMVAVLEEDNRNNSRLIARFEKRISDYYQDIKKENREEIENIKKDIGQCFKRLAAIELYIQKRPLSISAHVPGGIDDHIANMGDTNLIDHLLALEVEILALKART